MKNEVEKKKLQEIMEKQRRETEKRRGAKNLGETDPEPGARLFQILDDEYYKRNKAHVTNIETLFKFFLNIKKKDLQKKEKEEKNAKILEQTKQKIQQRRSELESKNQNYFICQEQYKEEQDISQTTDDSEKLMTMGPNTNKFQLQIQKTETQLKNEIRQEELQQIFKFKDKDVKYTLEKQKISYEAKLAQQKHEFNQKVMEKYNFQKYNNSFNQQINAQVTIQRLYGNPQETIKQKLNQKDKAKIEEIQYKNQVKNQQIQEKQQINQFVNTVIELYQSDFPTAYHYRFPDKLFNYWKEMDDKQETELECDEEEAKERFDIYFDNIVKDLINMHKTFKGFEVFDTIQLLDFWRTLSIQKRVEQNLYFESEDNLIDIIDIYLEKLQLEEEQLEQEMQLREEEEWENRQKLANLVLRKEITHTPIDLMAQPKDRQKIGKELLKIKKAYPNDLILTKMINQEFKDTKIAKSALEYDNFDEEHEAKVKNREIVSTYSQLRGRSNSIDQGNTKQFNLGNKTIQMEKTDQMAQIFEQQLEFFYDDKMADIRQTLHEQKELMREEKELKQYLEQEVLTYLDDRKRRYEENVASLTEFLSELYKIIRKQFPQATKHNFPFQPYGLSKEGKQRYFPKSLKSFFFKLVRSFVQDQKGDFQKDPSQKLPFWAPSGPAGKCRIHEKIACPPGCKYQTLNRVVYDHSKEKQKGDLWQDRPNQTAWDNQYYDEHKKVFLMQFDEIQNCSFFPQIANRIPKKIKAFMKKNDCHYDFVDKFFEKGGNLQKWIEKLGSNLWNQHPKIYRFGCLSRAKAEFYRKKYHDAYQILKKSFNLEQIKQFFLKEKYSVQPHVLLDPMEQEEEDQQNNNQNYQHQNEEKFPKPKEEDFSNSANKNFLNDVFDLIMQLEKKELELLKDEQKIKKELNYIQQNLGSHYQHPQNRHQLKNNLINSQQNTGDLDVELIDQLIGENPEINQNTQNNYDRKNYDQQQQHIQNSIQNPQQQKQLQQNQTQQQQEQQQQLQQVNQNNLLISENDPDLYNKLKLLVKEQMCPLGDQCPGRSNRRWPESNVRGTTPIGVSCIYAHTVQELQFSKQVKNREKMLVDRLNGIYSQMHGKQNTHWKPGNNPVTSNCTLSEGKQGKCGCAHCQERKINKEIIQKFKEKAAEKFQTDQNLRTKAKLRSNFAKNNYALLNDKLGSYTKAEKLFKKERYQEAFSVISELAATTKADIDFLKNSKKEKNLQIQQKLQIPIQIQDQQEFLNIYRESLRGTLDVQDPFIKQKLKKYGLKTGNLGQPQLDLDSFMNNQIENLYLKIEKKLKEKTEIIQKMEKSVAKMEKQQQIQQKLQQSSDVNDNQELTSHVICPIFNNKYQQYKEKKLILKEKNCGDPNCPYSHKIKAVNPLKKQFCPELQFILTQKNDPSTSDPVLNKPKKCSNKNCPYAHDSKELDILPEEEKINRFRQSIEFQRQNLGNSQAPTPFKPATSKQTRKTIEEEHNLWQQQQLEQGEPYKHKNYGENYNELTQSIQNLPYNQQKQIILDAKKSQQINKSVYNRNDQDIINPPTYKFAQKKKKLHKPRIELGANAWKASMLPLHHLCFG
ncbi:hypothetical protein PPERSA_03102 [Pseudocohnilembus persalinus]|uniref:Uncharacterized protein n=1 Tax=Pseudocohnilembus persalinus TaxID=266149 RepID=A0A0V0QRF9_PSEPJ|nr:hypothetical protein PPERSA_03102 [Pseudocohnilembus persalinus]|eukprot:KRX04711.1 hypothetical protein PPERSA_03102 [Pseudocohnilembus persalinus]